MSYDESDTLTRHRYHLTFVFGLCALLCALAAVVAIAYYAGRADTTQTQVRVVEVPR